MNKALLAIAALCVVASPAFAQADGDDGKYFHLKPPDYSIPRARKHAVHAKAKALRWYREHLGDKPIGKS